MSESAKILNLTNGSIVLQSTKSEKFVNDLLDGGMFWEYVSVLLEREATQGQNYIDHLNSKIDEINAKLDKLLAGGGAEIKGSPAVNSGGSTSAIVDELVQEAKRVKLDTSKLGGKGSGMLSRMSNMRRD